MNGLGDKTSFSCTIRGRIYNQEQMLQQLRSSLRARLTCKVLISIFCTHPSSALNILPLLFMLEALGLKVAVLFPCYCRKFIPAFVFLSTQNIFSVKAVIPGALYSASSEWLQEEANLYYSSCHGISRKSLIIASSRSQRRNPRKNSIPRDHFAYDTLRSWIAHFKSRISDSKALSVFASSKNLLKKIQSCSQFRIYPCTYRWFNHFRSFSLERV